MIMYEVLEPVLSCLFYVCAYMSIKVRPTTLVLCLCCFMVIIMSIRTYYCSSLVEQSASCFVWI